MVRLRLTGIKADELKKQLFQFHNGTIKTLSPNEIRQRLDYFNSIMVRLRRKRKFCQYDTATFQFHNGTIKTLATALHKVSTLYFNSIMVRLRQG